MLLAKSVVQGIVATVRPASSRIWLAHFWTTDRSVLLVEVDVPQRASFGPGVPAAEVSVDAHREQAAGLGVEFGGGGGARVDRLDADGVAAVAG